MTTLRQFEYLVTVVDSGSFTRAAQLLHVTQPALSHQMHALERDLGGPLLERLPRAVALTPLGRAVLPHARAALADAERARAGARAAAGLTAGELHLATVYSVTLGVLPPVLQAFRREHPGVAIRLREHRHGRELAEATAAGQGDLAIGPRPARWDGPVRSLGMEEMAVVVAADDEFARRRRITLGELSERDWVHYAPEHGLADVMDQACAAAGFRPRVAVRTEQTAAAAQLAAAGVGAALVPDTLIPMPFSGRVLRPQPPIRRELVAYTRGQPDPLTAAFVATLLAQIRLSPYVLDPVDAAPRHLGTTMRPAEDA